MSRDNEIALWGNDKRENDKQPTHKGQATVDGVEYWASGWTRDKGADPKYPAMKIKLTPKQDKPVAAATAPRDEPEFDDDIPF